MLLRVRRCVSTALMGVLCIGVCQAQDGFTVLFDGGSLDAWRGYKKDAPTDGWRVEDGVLKHSGGAGDLITREKYKDFDFRFQWRVVKGGNSGIIYRLSETDGPPYMTGPEYQILDNQAHKDGKVAATSAGALYAMYPPAEDVTRPVGKWNNGRIVIRNGRVQHWLNGKKLLEANWGDDDWNAKIAASKFSKWEGFAKNDEGHISLQDHGGQAEFRNIRIKRLDGAAARPAKRAKPAEPQADASERPARILFVTQSAGFRHPTVARKATDLSFAERVMTELGVRSGLFRVDCTQDVEKDFTPERLADYDIVMFYTTGAMYDAKRILPIPKETMDWFLNDWLKQPGHGFIGVHSAADTYHDYEPYWDMIGGTFNGHPWGAGSTVAISVQDPSHPASAPWGDSFVIGDEIYQFSHWQPEKVRVLMSLDMQNTDIKKPYHVPVLWVKDYGQGRVMHMSLGHREDVWTNPKYQESLLGGVRWIMGLAEGDATPNPEVSKAEEAKAREAVEQAKSKPKSAA
ncbi:Trehalose utilization [Pirellulimonas nuda]|uniref:Trehalose utilization n=1 Tax=Pirellulimonas nuda TaxID=2528009 RepID=A0A518DH37_9BACT|nr:family 16 glycoside hydrolase [Pirellulimonas nuda]QDU90785.1 Trehalose utilization [Pirellulimonas nuda]